MEENAENHFSKKILLLSVLFLMVNVAWYALALLWKTPAEYRIGPPKLVFSEGQEVLVKTPYDRGFVEARLGQTLITGTSIKTGNRGFAQIVLENNVLRLDENTEVDLLENNFREWSPLPYETDVPRLAFGLKGGNLWVNAFDPVEIQTARSSVEFSHTVGSFSYIPPMNRIMAIVGSADLTLKGESGTPLVTYVIPYYNQVAFVDTQIIQEYARLEPSKLRKELKLAPIAKSVLSDEWVSRNIAVDTERLEAKSRTIESSSLFSFWDKYYNIRQMLTVIPSAKRQLALSHTQTVLEYLLGAVQKEGDKALAQSLLNELDALIAKLPQDPLMKQILSETYFDIGTVDFPSVAYLIKDNLRDELLSMDGSRILRSYFSDIYHELEKGNPDNAEKIASVWLSKWQKKAVAGNEREFENQTRMFHSLLLSYSDRVTPGLLAALDQSEEMRLASAQNSEDTLFAVIQERLEMSKALVAAYRYVAAKNYLRQSYESLKIDELTGDVAAKSIFLDEAQYLAQRIEYAEKEMRGAAQPINETDYKAYLEHVKESQALSENLKTFLQVGEEEAPPVSVPKAKDVMDRFAASRISVIEEDIAPEADNPFSFAVKNARLIDRAPDGSSITFNGIYDYSTDAVQDLAVAGVPLRGNYDLRDLVAVLTKGGETKGEQAPADETLNFFTEANDEALRTQIMAQDMAKEILRKDLSANGVNLTDSTQVEVLDPATLSRFSIKGAFLTVSGGSKKSVMVDFEYSILGKMASSIVIAPDQKKVAGEHPLKDLSTLVSMILGAEEVRQASIKQFEAQLKSWDLILDPQNMAVEGGGDLVRFTDMKFVALPLQFDGVFDLKNNRFSEASHALLESKDVTVETYLDELGKKFIEDFLQKRGIAVAGSQITASYPFETIGIAGYGSGDQKFDFDVDLNNNQLRSVTVEGSGATVDSMTFDEFKIIAGEPLP